MSEPLQLAFDYEHLEPATRAIVLAGRDRIRERLRRTAEDIIEIGRELVAVKEALPHGMWGAWLRGEFDWTHDTASRFMQVFERFGHIEISQIAKFGTSALSLLAEDATPETARWEALERAEGEQHISYSLAREIVAYHRGEWEESMQEDDDAPLPRSKINAGLRSSASAAWNTPEHIISAVLMVWDRIDLDPCSNDGDMPNIPAGKHYTKDDNGLLQEWKGRVYMNPPYGKEISDWVDKLLAEHTAGRVKEAFALVPARVDTAWWARLAQFPVCFLRGRLKFSGAKNSAPFPSAIVYVGGTAERMLEGFEELGAIFVPFVPPES